MADKSNQTGKILMKNRIEEHLISATITEIEWERIHMHLTVNVGLFRPFRSNEAARLLPRRGLPDGQRKIQGGTAR